MPILVNNEEKTEVDVKVSDGKAQVKVILKRKDKDTHQQWKDILNPPDECMDGVWYDSCDNKTINMKDDDTRILTDKEDRYTPYIKKHEKKKTYLWLQVTCQGDQLDFDQKFFNKNRLEVDYNNGLITIIRKWEHWTGKNKSSATFGTFTFGNLKGYICEPYGEETTKSGKDKRIPAGTYNLIWHTSPKFPKNKYTSKNEDYKNFNLDFPPVKNGFLKVYNDKVPKKRGILIHAGQDGGWTEGCILPSKTLNKDLKKRNMKLKESIKLLYSIYDKVEELGVENVKLIIEDETD